MSTHKTTHKTDKAEPAEGEAVTPPTAEQIAYLDETARAAMGSLAAASISAIRAMGTVEIAGRAYDFASAMWEERVRRLTAAGVPVAIPAKHK